MIDSEAISSPDGSSTSNKMPAEKSSKITQWSVTLQIAGAAWGWNAPVLGGGRAWRKQSFLSLSPRWTWDKGREYKGGELVPQTGCQGKQTYSESREKHLLIQRCKSTEGFGNLEEKQPVRSTLSSWDYDEFLSSYWLLSPKYICCFMQLRLPMKCICRLNDSYNYRLKRSLHIHEYHTICHSCRPPVSNACD